MITPHIFSLSSNPLIRTLCQCVYTAQVTEYQFQQAANFVRALRATTSELLLQVNAEGVVLDINCSPEFNLFHDTANILRKNLFELIPSVQAPVLHAALERALREQKPTRYEWTLPIEQREHHFEVRVAYLRSDRALVILQDITAHHVALEQLRDLPRSLLNAQEAERRRLASDLHDEIGQDLTAILLAVNRAKGGSTDESRLALDETEAALQALTRKVRRLAQDLHPSTLNELGLAAALSSLLARYNQQTPLDIHWHLPGEQERFPRDIEVAAYRIVQEAITNVVRHAQAQQAWVTVYRSGQHLLLQIMDNGQGFDMGTTPQADHYGLLGMSERVTLLKGNIHIRSVLGRGTQISAELPLHTQRERTASS